MKTIGTFLLFIFSIFLFSCDNVKQTEKLFSHFLDKHVEKIKPLHKKQNEALWLTYTGKKSFQDLARAQKEIDSLYAKAVDSPEFYQAILNNVYENSSDFEILLKLKKSGLIENPVLKRQFLAVLKEYINVRNNWNEGHILKNELLEKYYAIKQTDAQFMDSICQKTDCIKYYNQWISRYKVLEDDYKKMVIALNNDAQKIGYSNYYELILDDIEVNPEHLEYMLEQVEMETHNDYRQFKEMLDDVICEKYKITKQQIEPQLLWQTTSQVFFPKQWMQSWSPDSFIQIIDTYFQYGDMDISGIIDNSDLWYSKNKINQSLFLCNVSSDMDLRIYSNIEPNTIGLYSLMHEFGHAVHHKYVDEEVPYTLKEPNSIAAEAVAIYFNDKLFHSQTLQKKLQLNHDANSEFYEIFSDPRRLYLIRILLRNIAFEKSIYENPNQNYTKLWWDLNKKYLLQKPGTLWKAPHWATNLQVISADGYNTVYLYANAFAAQLEYFYPDVEFSGLKERLFQYGDLHPWESLLNEATGTELNLFYLTNSYRQNNLFEHMLSMYHFIPSENHNNKYLKTMIDQDYIIELKLKSLL